MRLIIANLFHIKIGSLLGLRWVERGFGGELYAQLAKFGMTPFWIFFRKKILCFKFVFHLFKILFIHVRMYIMKVKFKLTYFFST